MEPNECQPQPTQSETIAKLAKATSQMQKTTLFAITDATNPFFSSKYATISSVWQAARVPLTDNGLAVIQTTEPYPDGVTVVTTLMHESGEWIRGRLSGIIVPDKKGVRTPQGLLSLVTYLRRAGLSAIVGICPVDDDGESLMHRGDTELPKNDERIKVPCPAPDDKSYAAKQVGEYHPAVEIMNEEQTHFKVGKFDVEITTDGTYVWCDVPKFGTKEFDMGGCVPCFVASLFRRYSRKHVEDTYHLKVTTYVPKDKNKT